MNWQQLQSEIQAFLENEKNVYLPVIEGKKQRYTNVKLNMYWLQIMKWFVF